MDNKRKSAAGTADGDDRAAKRRKVPQQQFDLFQGESKESTTQYGLQFLEQIRRTSDKSGRQVAGHFEQLIPTQGNEDYYRRTRMPISLDTIEQKLYDRYFNNMSELESYVKRMVQNAKDYYPRNSQIFEDAERVRKATSNYMVKTNPAYKLVHGYSAVPTPLPDSDEEPSAEPEVGATADQDVDAEGEEEEEDVGEEDAEGEDEEDEDAEADSDDDGPRGRRRGPGRPPRSLALQGAKTPDGPPSGTSRPDHEYENASYQSLTFQQAQEKIVEELIRKPDEDDDGYAYFEPFLNLPPRSLKDYYQVIKEPLSLKKLQKLVKGIHGRGERLGVTDYKTWAAFEEKASLLWQNAYYYNEDGSEIANMAKELEQCFFEQLRAAKAVVPEPAPPKIKIKMAPGQETPLQVGPKKITIHVANNRGSSADSPAPQTAGSASSDGGPNGSMVRNPFSGQHAAPQVQLAQLDKARSMSGSAPSPTPSLAMKREEVARQSPANGIRPNGIPPSGYNTPGAVPGMANHPYPGVPLQNGHHPPAAPPVTYDQTHRLAGRGVADALIRNLFIRTHPSLLSDPERRFRFQLPAHPKLAQQSVTVNIPASHWKQQIIISLNPSIQEQQRPYKLFVIINGSTVGPAVPVPSDPIESGAKLYEGSLHHGVNTIQVHLISALPKGQKLPNGSEVELEKMTVLANIMKH